MCACVLVCLLGGDGKTLIGRDGRLFLLRKILHESDLYKPWHDRQHPPRSIQAYRHTGARTQAQRHRGTEAQRHRQKANNRHKTHETIARTHKIVTGGLNILISRAIKSETRDTGRDKDRSRRRDWEEPAEK